MRPDALEMVNGFPRKSAAKFAAQELLQFFPHKLPRLRPAESRNEMHVNHVTIVLLGCVPITRFRFPLKQWVRFGCEIPKSFADRLNCGKPSVHEYGFCNCREGVVKLRYCAQLAVWVLRLRLTAFSTSLQPRKDQLDFSLGSFRPLFRTQLALRYLGKHARNDKRVCHLVNRRA